MRALLAAAVLSTALTSLPAVAAAHGEQRSFEAASAERAITDGIAVVASETWQRSAQAELTASAAGHDQGWRSHQGLESWGSGSDAWSSQANASSRHKDGQDWSGASGAQLGWAGHDGQGDFCQGGGSGHGGGDGDGQHDHVPAVPEPGSWALMLGGGLAAVTLRRRRRA